MLPVNQSVSYHGHSKDLTQIGETIMAKMSFGAIEGKDIVMMSAAAVGIGLGTVGVVMSAKNNKAIKDLRQQVGTITGAMASRGWEEAAPMTVQGAVGNGSF